MTPDGYAIRDGRRVPLTKCDACGEYYSGRDADHYCGPGDQEDP